ncbi:MAG: DUF3857 domain-containing protein, partial [Betaproteobacteria bacterium]|nr:DUF3857 domain-containing protein [Betaproteobacteria bacterium]
MRCFVVFLVFTFTLAERSPLTRIRRQFVIETVRQLTRIALGTVLGLTTLVTVSAAPATPNPTRTPPAPAPDPLVRNAFRPTHTMLRGLLQVQVNRDGSSTEISETLVRIETEAGVKAYSEQSHEYNGSLSNLEVLEAATIQSDGSRIDVSPDRILTRDHLGEEAAVLNTDGKVKVVVFPAVAVGSQLLLRLKTTQHTPEFPGHFISASYFSPHSRYESYTVELSHDPQIAIRVDAPGMTGGKVSSSKDTQGQSDNLVRYRYVFRQPQALPEELGELDDSDFAPGFSATSFASWEDLGRAYQARARPKAEVTDAIRTQALQIVGDATQTREKVRRLYHGVSRNIRYLGVYAGVGGYVPHAASDVLANRYGDCKDHVVLLEALLRAVGIESGPALVNSGLAFKLPRLASSTPLNHVISYIPALDLYLDSTSEFSPFGQLPEEVLGKPTVLAAQGSLGRTRAMNPEQDFARTRVWISLQPDGRMSGRSQTQTSGLYEVQSRYSQFKRSDRETSDVANAVLGRFGETGIGQYSHRDPRDLSQ